MNLQNFPLFQKLLSDPSVYGNRRFGRAYSADRLQRLDEALALWSRCQTAGEIENPRFIESKEVISRAVEQAWKMVPRDDKWLRALSEAQANALDTLPSPNLANIEGRLKRVEKTPPSTLRDELVAFMKEIQPITAAYAFLKDHSKKRVARSQEEIEATRFVPPPSSSKAVARVRTLLEQAVDRAYVQLLELNTMRNRETIQRYLDAQDQFLADPTPQSILNKRDGYSPHTHYTIKEGRHKGSVSDSHALAFLHKALDYQSGTKGQNYVNRYVASDNTWKISDAEAEKEAKLVRDQFVFKNLEKLTPILEAKGDDLFERAEEISHSVHMGSLEGDFKFIFKDGSAFLVHNSLVSVVNQYATHFYRFPLTFHDVLLPGGKPMHRPSEETMNTVFIKATEAKETQTVSLSRRRRSP